MLDWLKARGEEARAVLAETVARFNNREFMEAVVAGCTMVAAADGNIGAEEKKKMLGYMRVSRELRVFSTDEVIAAFNRFAEVFEFDADVGADEALKAIAKLRDKPDQSAAMIRVCCVIGSSDGTFDDTEKAVVRRICKAVDQQPGGFGL